MLISQRYLYSQKTFFSLPKKSIRFRWRMSKGMTQDERMLNTKAFIKNITDFGYTIGPVEFCDIESYDTAENLVENIHIMDTYTEDDKNFWHKLQFDISNIEFLTQDYISKLAEYFMPSIRVRFYFDGIKQPSDISKLIPILDMLKLNDYYVSRLKIELTADNIDDMDEWTEFIKIGESYKAFCPIYLHPSVTSEHQERIAQWMFDTGNYKKYMGIMANVGCREVGNPCIILEFYPDGTVLTCKDVGKVCGNWKEESIDTIITRRPTVFTGEQQAEECITCPYNKVCHSGCPGMRLNGIANDCTLKKKLYGLIIDTGRTNLIAVTKVMYTDMWKLKAHNIFPSILRRRTENESIHEPVNHPIWTL